MIYVRRNCNYFVVSDVTGNLGVNWVLDCARGLRVNLDFGAELYEFRDDLILT